MPGSPDSSGACAVPVEEITGVLFIPYLFSKNEKNLLEPYSWLIIHIEFPSAFFTAVIFSVTRLRIEMFFLFGKTAPILLSRAIFITEYVSPKIPLSSSTAKR